MYAAIDSRDVSTENILKYILSLTHVYQQVYIYISSKSE